MNQDIKPVLYYDAEDKTRPFAIRYEDEDGVRQFFPIFSIDIDNAVEEARRFGFYVTEAVNV